MTGRLLDRQARLLEYLTSGGAIFGRRRGALDPALQGIDRGLLDLEARFSHEKRREKIAGVFPATFALLGAARERVVGEFAEACPPCDISRIDNAWQFYNFLIARVKRTSDLPAYLSDVAACELACAEARGRTNAESQDVASEPDPQRPAIRCNPHVVLLRTAFDIRAVFEDVDSQTPAERPTHLAIAWVSGEPSILELTPAVFGVLAALDRWTLIHELPGADELVCDLAESGLLELRR